MNIISVFAGRKNNLEILKKYLKKALDLKIIDEVHFWNNTQNSDDEDYLKTISNLKRTQSTGVGNYILINPALLNNSFELNVKACNDIHIKITNLNTEYEIVLGGWNNNKSCIRENNNEIFNLLKPDIADGENYNKFQIKIINGTMNVIKNSHLIMFSKIEKNFEIKNIYFKTGYNSVGHLKYDATQNEGFYFMDPCEKTWENFYNHYTDKEFENDIIMKCDDDIVFIDVNKLPKFIEFVKNNDFDLVFANTINNGVCAHFQQNKFNLIPKGLMDLEYPVNGAKSSLWENGKKAECLHNYFIEKYKDFLDYEYNNEFIPINTRFSINFFGFKGINWFKIKDAHYGDDEFNLTLYYSQNRNFKNVIYSDFYVSHLSFYQQNLTGINLADLLNKYDNLYYILNGD
jgi:hypothetical protein